MDLNCIIVNQKEVKAMPKKPRMTLDDVLADMRAHGMSMGKSSLITCLKAGIFPFAHIIGEPSGKTNFLIMRRDYEKWAEEYLYYLE